MLLHPLSFPHPLLPNPPKPLLPPQQQSKIMIINMQLKLLLLPLLSHPQFVAVKSLMYEPPICYYNVSYVTRLARFHIFLNISYAIIVQFATFLHYFFNFDMLCLLHTLFFCRTLSNEIFVYIESV